MCLEFRVMQLDRTYALTNGPSVRELESFVRARLQSACDTYAGLVHAHTANT